MNILFLCTGNSCRSQMAEGWSRHLLDDNITVWSAGIEKHGINPLAVQAMAEAGVDISKHTSKLVDELDEQEFDYVITVCDHANELCPLFTGQTHVLHKGFEDPPRLAAGAADENEALIHYRRVRDEIRDFIKQIPEILLSNTKPD